MEIQTKSGFKCKVDERRIKDWQYVTMSAKLAKESNELELIETLDNMLVFLLGEEQRTELLLHLQKEYGFADSTTVISEFKFITEQLGEQLKKSMPSQA